MKIGLALRFALLGVESSVYADVAGRAEALGFESFWVADHLVLPGMLARDYPYGGTGRGPIDEEMAYLDPWITLTFLGAVTKHVRLGTNVFLLPLRNPFVTAKAVATADVISGGRTILGVGVGWLESEYEAVGETFSNRGRRCDELIEAIKALWTESTVDFSGEHYAFSNVKFAPKPVRKPHPPIYCGGNSPLALRRAATRCDGWLAPPDTSIEDFQRCVNTLADLRSAAGRDHLPFALTRSYFGRIEIDEIRATAAAGADRLIIMPWKQSSGLIPIEAVLEEFQRIADAGELTPPSP